MLCTHSITRPITENMKGFILPSGDNRRAHTNRHTYGTLTDVVRTGSDKERSVQKARSLLGYVHSLLLFIYSKKRLSYRTTGQIIYPNPRQYDSCDSALCVFIGGYY